MSNKDKNNSELWSRKFGEEENHQDRQYSRSARKSEKKEVAPLLKVLLFLFSAILIIPIVTIAISNYTQEDPEPLTNEQVMMDKKVAGSETVASDSAASESSSAQAEESSSAEEDSSSESEASSSSESSTDTESESSSSVPEEEQDEAGTAAAETEETETGEPAAAEEETETEAGNTYTVQAGDNLYRIAVNHGMTLEELKSLNGLTSNEAVIGMELKVN